MKQIFYIPIKTVNLGHYFGKACICPVKYLIDRNEDLQNIYKEHILLCNEKFTDVTNCCLEVMLTEYELSKYIAKLNDNFFLLKVFIPISRILGIYFNNKDQGEKTIWNIEQGKAFIPIRLVHFESDYVQVETRALKDTNLISNNLDNDNEISLDRYNRLLGGFALMRLGGESFMNYSSNYFVTLSNINNRVKRELEQVTKNISIPVDNKYEWLLFNNKPKFEDLYKLTYKNISVGDLEKFAAKNNVGIKKNVGKINLDSIDKNSTTYLIAILVSYAEIAARRTIDNFISDLVQDQFPSEKKEGISIMFGINKGYECFRNQYKTENFEAEVKFRLNSEIDYYTIESVYQFVLNNSICDSFPYLERIIPANKNIEDLIKFKTYNILNCSVIYGKKPVSLREVIDSFLNRLFFSDFTNPLINNFERVIGFNLTKEQSEKKSKEYERLLINPLQNFLDKLRVEIDSFHEENILKLKKELVAIHKEKEDINNELKKINYNLFTEIDRDFDGKLSSNEVGEFINRLLKLKCTDNTEKIIKKEVIDSTNISSKELSNSILKDNTNPFGDLFASDNQIIQNDNNSSNTNIEKRKKQLSAMGITSLRDEATKVGIKSVSRFKNTPEDKEKLINLILFK